MAKAQRQPSESQLDAAKRILGHNHTRTYTPGAQGTTIRALQIFLASKGYAPGGFDGKWGKKTLAAYNAFKTDRGQDWNALNPKALSFISKEFGQPLPRQRPADTGQFIGGNGAPPVDIPTPGDVPDAAPMPTRDFTPPPAPMPAAPVMPNPSQSAEREYDPNVLHAATMNRNEPADMAQQLPDYQQPTISPDPGQYGNDLRQLSEMQPADTTGGGTGNLLQTLGMDNGADKYAAAQSHAPADFDPSRLDQGSMPVTSDMGTPDNLIENMRARQQGSPARTLRDALMGSGGRPEYPAPNQPNLLDALRQALLAGR